MTTQASHDAVIMGGGLAGLALALQLRGAFADMHITVLERRSHPLPDAAHKVGESVVEIGAHYLAETLGLRDHLEQAHIHKFGFRFFFSDSRPDLGAVTELGVTQVLPTPSYQLDRGILETFMAREAQRRGITFHHGASISGIEMGTDGAAHQVRWRDAQGEHAIQARWLLDASGRAALLRRRFDLTRDNGHAGNAAWFRLGEQLPVDEWCGPHGWQAECSPPERWRSTNHLCGPGYWAWLIPLASGAHSVGVVSDANMHPFDSMRRFDGLLDWLGTRQPLLAREVAARRASLLDFAFLRNYSHGCAQHFSADRWAITGEAGAFLDPFYSPGTDFIAIVNTYIVDMIGHDRAGRHLGPHAHIYEQLLQSFFSNTLSLYRGQYALMGDAQVLPVKVIWDYAYYWGILCQLVFQQRLTDLSLLGAVRPQLERAQALNARMQTLFTRWHAASDGRNPPAMLDQCDLPWFAELNRGLHDRLSDAGMRERIGEHVDLLDALADAIARQAGASDAALRAFASGRSMRRPPELFRTAA